MLLSRHRTWRVNAGDLVLLQRIPPRIRIHLVKKVIEVKRDRAGRFLAEAARALRHTALNVEGIEVARLARSVEHRPLQSVEIPVESARSSISGRVLLQILEKDLPRGKRRYLPVP